MQTAGRRSDANTAKLISGLRRRRSRVLQSTRRRERASSRSRRRFGSGTTRARSSKKFYGPGIFVLGLSMFPPLLAALAMAKEGEQKTILQVYVSSISAHEFLLGKILAFMVIAFAEWVAADVSAVHVFRSSPGGRPDAASGRDGPVRVLRRHLRHMVGAAIPSQAAAIQAVALGGFLLVFLLSGLIFPSRTFPPAFAGSRTSSGAATTSRSCATRCCRAAAGRYVVAMS